MKTYYAVMNTMNVWQVVDDLQAIGLTIKSVTANSITVACTNGYTINQINVIMSNRGYI